MHWVSECFVLQAVLVPFPVVLLSQGARANQRVTLYPSWGCLRRSFSGLRTSTLWVALFHWISSCCPGFAVPLASQRHASSKGIIWIFVPGKCPSCPAKAVNSEGQGSMRIAPGHTMRRPQPTGLIPQVKPSYSHRHPLPILGAWPAKDSNLYVLRQDQTTTEVDWVAVRCCWHLTSRSSRWRWRRSWPNWNPWKISFWEKSWRKNLRVTKRCLSWTWGRQWPRPKGHPAKRYHCQTGMVRQLKNEAPQEADICWACSFPIPEILVALTNLDVWPRHIRNVWLMVSHVQP